MTINPNLGYELGPGRSYNSLDTPYANHLRALQYRAEQEILFRMGMTFYPEYKPQLQARTDMKTWLRVLQDDIHTNYTRINALETEPQQPLPTEDAKLMKLELHLRKALADILTQRTCTEAAKQAQRG